MSSDKEPKRGEFNAVAAVSHLGFTMAVPIVLGALAGNWLDKKLGAHGLVLVGLILLGVLAGGVNAYRILAKVISWKD